MFYSFPFIYSSYGSAERITIERNWKRGTNEGHWHPTWPFKNWTVRAKTVQVITLSWHFILLLIIYNIQNVNANASSIKSLSFLSLPLKHESNFWETCTHFVCRLHSLLLYPLDSFCQSLFDIMENTPGLRLFWNTVKSLLQGKVLYAPDTPAARLIVKEVRRGKRLQCGEIWRK